MYKLSKRLNALVDCIEPNDLVLDIGTDHGKLAIALLKKYPNMKVIASDVKKSALDGALSNSLKENIKLDLRLGNGLSVVENGEVDTLVIAGMGAMTILGILSDKEKLSGIKKIIIQSNNNHILIRKKLIKLGYYISFEKLLKENVYYTIIVFKLGHKKYSCKELFFGPILFMDNSEIFKEKQKEELKNLLVIRKLIPRKKIITRIKISHKINYYMKK